MLFIVEKLLGDNVVICDIYEALVEYSFEIFIDIVYWTQDEEF